MTRDIMPTVMHDFKDHKPVNEYNEVYIYETQEELTPTIDMAKKYRPEMKPVPYYEWLYFYEHLWPR